MADLLSNRARSDETVLSRRDQSTTAGFGALQERACSLQSRNFRVREAFSPLWKRSLLGGRAGRIRCRRVQRGSRSLARISTLTRFVTRSFAQSNEHSLDLLRRERRRRAGLAGRRPQRVLHHELAPEERRQHVQLRPRAPGCSRRRLSRLLVAEQDGDALDLGVHLLRDGLGRSQAAHVQGRRGGSHPVRGRARQGLCRAHGGRFPLVRACRHPSSSSAPGAFMR